MSDLSQYAEHETVPLLDAIRLVDQAREAGAAEVRARVEAVCEAATQRAYFDIALDRMLTIQTCGHDRALVPPHWRDEAEADARVSVADLRAALNGGE